MDRIEELVTSLKAPKPNGSLEKHHVTMRLSPLRVAMLDEMAEKSGITRTKLAEKIMSAALEEVVEAYGTQRK